MKKNYLITLAGVLLFFNAALAQESKIKSGDKKFDSYNFIDARNIYLSVVENGYSSQDVYEKLGDSYYFNAELDKASKWYAKLYYEYKDTVMPEYLFRYSQTLKNLGDYKSADKVMADFNRATNRSEQRSKIFMEKPDYLNLIELQSGKFEIKNLPINSPQSDFGPSFLKDNDIVFASSRGTNGSKVIHDWSKTNFLDLYISKRESKNTSTLIGVEKMKGAVNTRFHESTPVFTNDGNTMYFTRNNFVKNKRKTDASGTTLLKLYKADRNTSNGKWNDVVELPFNGDEYSTAHPALSPDNSKLYFSSNMPGTMGLSDIFYVEIYGGNKYSEPINLGKNVNTEGRETFPFISKSGDLYFSSDAHVGLGGLDVFVSMSQSGNFEEPYNLGKPLNSSFDDFSFIIDNDTKMGYFTSNRSGGVGNDDIYSFTQKSELITNCSQFLSGVITDSETRLPLSNTKVSLYDDSLKLLSSAKTDNSGKYDLPINCNKKYIIRADKEGYGKTEVDFASTNDYEFKHNQPLQLTVGKPELGIVKTNLGDDLGKILQLEPIYFDFDKSYIRPDAEIELQKVIAVLKQYPNMKIDVRSHTDSRAKYNYNISLSSRRNKETINYIIQKGGISVSRLTGRGYGETQLTNGCADGIDCTEEQHQLNRRSEFIIVKQ